MKKTLTALLIFGSATAFAKAPKVDCRYSKNSQEKYSFFNDAEDTNGGYTKTKAVDGLKFEILINDEIPSREISRGITVVITDTKTGISAIAQKNLILKIKDSHHVMCDFEE